MRTIYYMSLLLLVISSILVPLSYTSAQDPLEAICVGDAANSPACTSRTTQNPILGPSGIVTRVIQILVMITAVISVIMISVGGFKYVISMGDSNNINSAKNTILYAVIGLVIAIFGQFIVSFVLSRV